MNKLTFKEKDKIVRKIYKNFKRAQLDILYMSQHFNYYPTIDVFKVKEAPASSSEKAFLVQIEKKQRLEEYVKMVQQVHQHLSKDSLFFIENEYLNYYDSSWWYSLYSKATYYRIKHKAIDEFIECIMTFYDEEEILHLLK